MQKKRLKEKQILFSQRIHTNNVRLWKWFKHAMRVRRADHKLLATQKCLRRADAVIRPSQKLNIQFNYLNSLTTRTRKIRKAFTRQTLSLSHMNKKKNVDDHSEKLFVWFYKYDWNLWWYRNGDDDVY